MTDIRIEMFPAKQGDSFLVTCGPDTDEKVHILIDTGFKHTYDEYIKPRLQELADQGEELDLVVITHIDEDHIKGSIWLFDDPVIKINEVWHNGYRTLHCLDKSTDPLDTDSKELLEVLARSPLSTDEEKGPSPANAEQGAALAALLRRGAYNWNSRFGGAEVCVENSPDPLLIKGVEITLLSPNREHLKRLETLVVERLYNYRYRGDLMEDELFEQVFESLLLREKNKGRRKKVEPAASEADQFAVWAEDKSFDDEDDSATNGSSIAFVLEYNKKRVLFLADSHPSVIIHNLEQVYPSIRTQPETFDAIKVSHHGSVHNTSPELLELVDSTRFIISTNGNKHGHPDKQTIARIVGRDTECRRSLYVNYETQTSRYLSTKALRTRFKYSVEVPEVSKSQIIEL